MFSNKHRKRTNEAADSTASRYEKNMITELIKNVIIKKEIENVMQLLECRRRTRQSLKIGNKFESVKV